MPCEYENPEKTKIFRVDVLYVKICEQFNVETYLWILVNNEVNCAILNDAVRTKFS
jgi:hypothetical protein